MKDHTSPISYRFGRFELQPGERRLLVAGERAVIGPRAFDLLVVLVERAGRLVVKDELLDLVWPNLVVEANNLQLQISSLRKILGPEAIATVPGRGYRFALQADLDGHDAARADAARSANAADAERSASGPGASASSFPPLRSLDATPNNLPQQLTSFIGREKEIAEIKALLATTRLLTLTGSGGCGKTRLSLQVAAEAFEQFPDGVWLVELAPLSDSGLVAQTVAIELGLKEEPSKPIVQTLTDHFKDRRLLLLLDNCEHLLDDCAKLADVLVRRCPHVKIIATSREALGIGGEQAYRVPSLSLPDPKETHTAASVATFEAVQLFTNRALLARSNFEVTDQNAATLASICYRLDGIPLAIELAAARMRSLSVEEINSKLDHRFQLLTRGARTALPRQQTLRSLIDWSYDLLHEAEKLILQRLSVFAGGWTLAAAELVCTGDGVHTGDVLDLLTSLADKSLVVMEQNGATSRYQMLETVRRYAEECLNEAGKGDEVRTRHLLHYIALGQRAGPDLDGPRRGEWYAALWNEQENLVAAHAWCAHAAQGGEHALSLTASLWRYWFATSQYSSGYRLAEAALDLNAGDPDSVDRGRALLGMTDFALRLGRYDIALSYAERSLAIGRTLDDIRPDCECANRGRRRVPIDWRDIACARLLRRHATWRGRRTTPIHLALRSTALQKSSARPAISPTPRRTTSRRSRWRARWATRAGPQ